MVSVETAVPVLTLGAAVVVAAVPYSVDWDRVAELQPASARPARQRTKIDLFIGDFELRED